MTTPETMEERFDRLGGEELLEDFDEIPLPEGHLTRGFNWPETKRELDTKKVKDFMRQEIALAVQKREEELREKIEKIIQDERFSGAPYVLNQVLNLLSPN